MRLLPQRRPGLPDEARANARLAKGDRVLAWAEVAEGGWLLGTRTHLVHVPVDAPPARLAWSEVQAADWASDTGTLSVSEVGEFGRPRTRRTFRLDDGDLLLQLVRERVQASIVLQRHTPVHGNRGVTVVVRRQPDGALALLVEYDEGVDPGAEQTARIVEAAVARARDEVGAEPI